MHFLCADWSAHERGRAAALADTTTRRVSLVEGPITLSRLLECLFRLVANNNAQIKTLAAECIINLRDYEDKSRRASPEILRSTLNRQYINLSIKTKAGFAKFLLGRLR